MKTQRNILIAFILNLSFAVFELFGGLWAGSVAILSDAVHDAGDSFSIGISYFLEKKSKKVPDSKYTYGYLRYSVLGSIITTVILILSSGIVIYNAILRLLTPTDINYNRMIIFAAVGLIVNSIAAVFTKGGESLNQRAVNIHMLEDVLGWAIVFIGAIVMKVTDIRIIDPILSICVAAFIFVASLKGLKNILDLFLEKTPQGILVGEIKERLCRIEGVSDIHHIHVRSIDGFHNYATLHAVINSSNIHQIKQKIRNELSELNIHHVTIETETEQDMCEYICCNLKEILSDENSHSHAHHHHH